MAKLTTLNCPSCGAPLKVDPQAGRYRCDYCGTVHVLQGVNGVYDPEEEIWCPACGRMDQVKRLSGVMAADPTFASRFSLPPKLNISYKEPEGKVKQSEKKATVLYDDRSIIGGIIELIAAGGIFFLLWIWENGDFALKLTLGMFSVLPLLVWSLWNLFGLDLLGDFKEDPQKKKSKDVKKTDQEQTLEHVKQLMREVNDVLPAGVTALDYQSAINYYHQAMRRIDQVYYCERDDAVFIPGEIGAYNVSQLTRLLFSNVRTGG